MVMMVKEMSSGRTNIILGILRPDVMKCIMKRNRKDEMYGMAMYSTRDHVLIASGTSLVTSIAYPKAYTAAENASNEKNITTGLLRRYNANIPMDSIATEPRKRKKAYIQIAQFIREYPFDFANCINKTLLMTG
jgi:hypothetical protein